MLTWLIRRYDNRLNFLVHVGISGTKKLASEIKEKEKKLYPKDECWIEKFGW